MKTNFFADAITPQHQLIDFLLGPIRWNIIHVAFELNLFDYLIEPKTSKDIAGTLAFKPPQTELLLDALCGLNFLTKTTNDYQLKEELAPYLTSNSEYSMRDMMLHLSNVKHTDIHTLCEILKTGESKHLSSGFRTEAFWHNSQKSLRSYHVSINNDLILNALRHLPEWQTASSFLDLGAGTEALSIALMKEKPELDVTLFDQPSCINYIETKLSKDTNIKLLSGDFNHDDIGKGYDIILSSMSLYYARDLQSVLRKIKQALNKGGVFLSFHEALQEERTQPERHITGRLLPSMSGNDLSFDDSYIASQLALVGFERIRHQFIDSPMGQMRLDIGSA